MPPYIPRRGDKQRRAEPCCFAGRVWTTCCWTTWSSAECGSGGGECCASLAGCRGKVTSAPRFCAVRHMRPFRAPPTCPSCSKVRWLAAILAHFNYTLGHQMSSPLLLFHRQDCTFTVELSKEMIQTTRNCVIPKKITAIFRGRPKIRGTGGLDFCKKKKKKQTDQQAGPI